MSSHRRKERPNRKERESQVSDSKIKPNNTSCILQHKTAMPPKSPLHSSSCRPIDRPSAIITTTTTYHIEQLDLGDAVLAGGGLFQRLVVANRHAQMLRHNTAVIPRRQHQEDHRGHQQLRQQPAHDGGAAGRRMRINHRYRPRPGASRGRHQRVSTSAASLPNRRHRTWRHA